MSQRQRSLDDPRGSKPTEGAHQLKWEQTLVFLGYSHIWVFPKIVVPQKGWFIMENPIKMDDLGAPPFKETSIYYPAIADFLVACLYVKGAPSFGHVLPVLRLR